MSRDSKKKLAIVAGLSECLIYAEARFCAFEIHGDPKYYVCSSSQYCCNFGCCESKGFSIYHLGYYWLVVLIMFLVCSGVGGWWYRYWLQGRYRAAASAIPSRGTGSSRNQSTLRGPTCRAQQASITYNSARNTVFLHRMWKAGGSHRAGSCSSPAYPGPPASASSTNCQNTSVVLNDVKCPYYQLYGPPPSYETVIAQTRGKITSPLSPGRTRNLDELSATGCSITSVQDLSQFRLRCGTKWSWSSVNRHPSQSGSLAGIQDSSSAISCYDQTVNQAIEPARQIDQHEASPGFSSYIPSSYPSNSSDGSTPVHPPARQEACLPLDYHAGPIPPLDYHSDASTIVPDPFRIYNRNDLERLPSYHGERSSLDPKYRRIDDSSLAGCSISEINRSSLPGDSSHSSVPDLKSEPDVFGRKARTTQDDQRERFARHHGGSLKYSRTRDEAHPAAVIYGSFRRGQTFLEIATGSSSSNNCRNNSVVVDDDDDDDSDVNIGKSSKNCNNTIFSRDNESSNLRECRLNDDDDDDDYRDCGEQASFSRSTRNGLLNGDNCRESLRRYGLKNSQLKKSNPSDNVILEPLNDDIKFDNDGAAAAKVEAIDVDENNDNDDNDDDESCWRIRRHEQDERRRRRVPSPGARGMTKDDDNDGVIDNHESKHNKLDRSKSLD